MGRSGMHQALIDERLDAGYEDMLTGPFGVDPWTTIRDGDDVFYVTDWSDDERCHEGER